MISNPILSCILIGQLKRDFILPPSQKPLLDVPGGNLFYSAIGFCIWQSGAGLVARVGEDYPRDWLFKLNKLEFDTRGIQILSKNVDLRNFIAYTAPEIRHHDSPISHFARLGIPFPKSLLGYSPPGLETQVFSLATEATIRRSDFPDDYLDATAAHICPVDFVTHTILPSILKQGNLSTITLEPTDELMTPSHWEEVPNIVKGLTALITSEENLTNLFQGRSSDIWEMIECLAGYGCEMVVVKCGARGQWLFDHESKRKWIIPAYAGKLVNPTGAGDSFCGGFLYGYRSKYDPLEAALHGNISASLVIEGDDPFYALDSLPGLKEMRLETLRDRVRKV